MSTPPPPFEVLKRQTLSAQAAAAIRKSLLEGTWPEYLPSERRLCTLYQVSRPTIRKALQQLAREGLFDIRHGRRNRILVPPKNEEPIPHRLVVIVTPEHADRLALHISQSLWDMKLHLAKEGFVTEVVTCSIRGTGIQRQKLQSFLRQNPVFCCVLLSVSKEVQLWFSERSIPALVFGTLHPGVKLPSLDVDNRAVCRHATGLLLGKGHRRIALVMPQSSVAGYLVSEQGFLEAFAPYQQEPGIHASVVRHNDTAQNITVKLDALFKTKRAPTALLVTKRQHVFVVLVYLLKRGLSVPESVSLIARDSEHLFQLVSPTIAHYHVPVDALAQRLSRMMMQFIAEGRLPSEPNLIIPEYFPGETVKAPARSSVTAP